MTLYLVDYRRLNFYFPYVYNCSCNNWSTLYELYNIYGIKVTHICHVLSENKGHIYIYETLGK